MGDQRRGRSMAYRAPRYSIDLLSITTEAGILTSRDLDQMDNKLLTAIVSD